MKKVLLLILLSCLVVSTTSCHAANQKNSSGTSVSSSKQSASSSSAVTEGPLASSSQSDSSSAVSSSSESTHSSSTASSSKPASSAVTVKTASSSKDSSAPRTSSKATSVPPATTEKPIAFDDSLLEKMLRAYAQKPSGSVYPSNFNKILSDNVFLQYQAFNNLSVLMNGASIGNSVNFYENTTGRVKSFNALKTIPFQEITINYSIPSNAIDTVYTFDVSDFASMGTLNLFVVYGNHNSDVENQHIRSDNLKNFSALSKCSGLTDLKLYDCQGVDLSAVSGLHKLQYVGITDCGVSSISGLKNSSQLKTLVIDYNPVTDLSPLKGSKSLTDITLRNLSSVDSATLLSLPNLKTLEIADCPLIAKSVYTQLKQKGVTMTFVKNGLVYTPY